jgi:hypothetical protein
MPIVLKCPVCGRDVLSRQLELLVSASLTNHAPADTVVCHCPDSHRFVASLKHVEQGTIDERSGEPGPEKKGAAAARIH